jgi:Ankyrin repeat
MSEDPAAKRQRGDSQAVRGDVVECVNKRQPAALAAVLRSVAFAPEVVQFAWMSAWHTLANVPAGAGFYSTHESLSGILDMLKRRCAAAGASDYALLPAYSPSTQRFAPAKKRVTALGIAVHFRCSKCIQLLITEYGADVNAVSDDAGHIPVSQACAAGDFDIAEELLRLGGSLHSTIAGSLQNPLHEAVAAADSALILQMQQLDVEYCARAGSSTLPLVAQQYSAGRTPLHICAASPGSSNDVQVIWELLLNNVEYATLEMAARQQDAAGRTVLHVLIHRSSQLLQKCLHALDRAGCVHTVLVIGDSSGTTAAVLAQRIGCRDVIAALARYAPEVSIQLEFQQQARALNNRITICHTHALGLSA